MASCQWSTRRTMSGPDGLMFWTGSILKQYGLDDLLIAVYLPRTSQHWQRQHWKLCKQQTLDFDVLQQFDEPFAHCDLQHGSTNQSHKSLASGSGCVLTQGRNRSVSHRLPKVIAALTSKFYVWISAPTPTQGRYSSLPLHSVRWNGLEVRDDAVLHVSGWDNQLDFK